MPKSETKCLWLDFVIGPLSFGESRGIWRLNLNTFLQGGLRRESSLFRLCTLGLGHPLTWRPLRQLSCWRLWLSPELTRCSPQDDSSARHSEMRNLVRSR